jgi:Cupin
MDALSEVLRVIRLDSAIYFNAEFSEPWCLRSPNSCELATLSHRAPGM